MTESTAKRKVIFSENESILDLDRMEERLVENKAFEECQWNEQVEQKVTLKLLNILKESILKFTDRLPKLVEG